MLDPLMALIGYSEYTFMRFNRIKEPFVRYVEPRYPDPQVLIMAAS